MPTIQPDRGPGTWVCDRCDRYAENPAVIQVECYGIPLAFYRLCLRCDEIRHTDRAAFMRDGWRRHRR